MAEIQNPLVIKNSQQTQKKKGEYLKLMKGILEEPTANIILNGERLNAPLLKSNTRRGRGPSPLLLNIVLQVPASAVKEEKEAFPITSLMVGTGHLGIKQFLLSGEKAAFCSFSLILFSAMIFLRCSR